MGGGGRAGHHAPRRPTRRLPGSVKAMVGAARYNGFQVHDSGAARDVRVMPPAVYLRVSGHTAWPWCTREECECPVSM